jgi:diphosphomevalonate decarboxylase
VNNQTSTALAHPNIALIKYWGNRDDALRIPANGSISMCLEGLVTRTRVEFESRLTADELTINDIPAAGLALERLGQVLDLVRRLAGIALYAQVDSYNNFPSGAGIASSASAFAALALAASSAAGLKLSEAELSRLARRGSGSACRSVPAGFVEWAAGTSDEDSYAQSIASPEHWDLVDCIAIVSREHKATGSSRGNSLAVTSPLQAARVADTPRRLDLCRSAVCGRDFEALAEIVELDSNLLHAVMMTSTPALFYWQPTTLTIMQVVRSERTKGLPVCYTIDAGANVHVLTLSENAGKVADILKGLAGVQDVLMAGVGSGARLVESEI